MTPAEAILFSAWKGTITADNAEDGFARVRDIIGRALTNADLADAVASLVSQMREEQKIVRQWAQGQQTQQNEIQRLLVRATGPLSRGATRTREDERP